MSAIDEHLPYTLHLVSQSIEKIDKILKGSGTPKSIEYYSVLQEAMLSLAACMRECQHYSKMYSKLLLRIEILEMALVAERKAKL